jgi:branched-subunit amino acid transport protein
MKPDDTILMWLLLVLTGAGTFALRLSFIQLLGRVKVAPGTTRVLRFVPCAVLAALIFPAVFAPVGSLEISVSDGRIVAALVATVVTLIWKNTLATICSGMAALWLYQALML